MSHGERAEKRSNKRRELDNRRCKKVKCAPTSKFAKKLTHQVERRNAATSLAERKA